MDHTPHCAVIGAGLPGLCTALELLERGCAVTLLERDTPGKGASFGNAGFIASEAVDPLGTADTIRKGLAMLLDRHGALSVPPGNWHRSLPWLSRFVLSARSSKAESARVALSSLLRNAAPSWQALLAREGLLSHWREVHYLRLWEHASGEAAARAEAAFYRSWGIDAEFADHERMASLEPALRGTARHAVVLPHAHRVSDPWLLSVALLAAFERRGGRWLRQSVQSVLPSGQGVLIDGQAYDRAVVCAGAHSADLLRPLGLRIPLMAERGYHLNLPTLHGLLNGPVCSADRNVFINPLDGGLRVVGFSELGGTELPARAQRFDSLRHHLGSLLPQTTAHFAQASEWMGMRPTLPDSLPVLGTHPQHPQIGLAFGHQHIGVTLAAFTGQVMAAQLLGQPAPVDLAPFAAQRFPFTGSRP